MAVSGERVKLSPLIFFFRNLSPALYYLNAWKKTGYLAILVYFPDALERVLRVLVKRETSAKLARETHAPEDWVLRQTNMATNQTV